LEGLIAMPVDKKTAHEKQEDEIIDRTAPPGEVMYEELAFSGLDAVGAHAEFFEAEEVSE
jgi:hypothetical protein